MSPRVEVYRPRQVLTVMMAAAAMLWLAAFVFLVRLEGSPTKLWAGSLAFGLFFLGATLYYARTAIFVDRTGMIYRGMMRRRALSFADIRKLDILPGPIVIYAVRTRSGLMCFSSLFRQHRQLMAVLVERAGLNAAHG